MIPPVLPIPRPRCSRLAGPPLPPAGGALRAPLLRLAARAGAALLALVASRGPAAASEAPREPAHAE